MILDKKDTEYASNYFIDYYNPIQNIEDYQRMVKLSRMEAFSTPLLGMGGIEDDLYDVYDIHPKDMEFEIIDCAKDAYYNTQHCNDLLEITTSAPVEAGAPVRMLRWILKEKTTNKVVGFIRVCSPFLNCKPRHDWLGTTPKDDQALNRFNQHVAMGSIIIPVQPFGFNYIGGKLLALLCICHETREAFNQKYGADLALFETTSLYGSSKQSSQYDGMKPFLRYKGLTESNFIPLLHDEKFRKFEKWFIDRNDGNPLVTTMTSRKMRAQNTMLTIVRKSLKEHNPEKLVEFEAVMNRLKDITEQKRYYISTLGYSNSREVVLGQETELKKNEQNWHKFEWEFMLDWWKKKAGNRFENLRKEGRLRTELEVWNRDMDIQIIR